MDLQSYKNLSSNQSKIIHFVAKWCLACSINDGLLKKYKNNVVIIDYDECPEIVQYEGITKLPTVLWDKHKIEGISTFKLKKLLKSFDQR